MNQPDPKYQQAMGSSRKMLQAMVGIGLLCALLIVLTYEGTASRIEHNRAEALERAIFRVLPGTETTAPYQLNEQDMLVVPPPETQNGNIVYAGFDGSGKLTGVAITASGQGYADVLRILYGYDPEKEAVVGIYVLESKETPGLGDKIEKDPDFLKNFEALDVSLNEEGTALKNRVVPVKSGTKENPWEVDGITGATISSRAIGNILGNSTEKWIPLIHNQQEQLAPPTKTEDE
jgi:electron transport complex protein RnfG